LAIVVVVALVPDDGDVSISHYFLPGVGSNCEERMDEIHVGSPFPAIAIVWKIDLML
jgi:hypothetical protein